MKTIRFTPRVLVAIGVAFMALPLAVQGIALIQEDGPHAVRALFQIPTGATMQDADAAGNRSAASASRQELSVRQRLRNRALERCRGRTKSGAPCSLPSDPATYETAPAVRTAGSRSDAANAAAPREELTSDQLTMLRSYVKAGYCSPAAGTFIYDLCVLQLGADAGATAPRGILTDNFLLHSAGRSVIPVLERLRARIMQTSEDLGSTGTIRGETPGRFQGGLYD